MDYPGAIEISSDDEAAIAAEAAAKRAAAKKAKAKQRAKKVAAEAAAAAAAANKIVMRRGPRTKLSNTKEPKAKMWFPRAYTNTYIKWYKEFPSKLRFFCGGHVPIEVTMIMSKGKRQGAQITTNWSQVVSATGMQHGDIFMFRFRHSPRDGLKLLVQPVM